MDVTQMKPRERSVSDHAEWAKLREEGLRKIAEAGIKVGDIITVCWKESDATRSHMGKLLKIEGSLHIDGSSKKPAFLQIGFQSIHSVRAERPRATEKVKTCVCEGQCSEDCERMFVGKMPENPFMALDPKNPFI